MISEDLRKKMEEAYLAGDTEEALRLSQELDVQVVEEQRRLWDNAKESNNSSEGLEVNIDGGCKGSQEV